MAFQKGNPGKKKGTRNKSKVAVEETAARLGIDPFEVLCLFAKADWQTLGFERPDSISPHMQLKAATNACKYLYAQKRSVEISNPDGTGFKVEVTDYTAKKVDV